jgi:hypothetical protein
LLHEPEQRSNFPSIKVNLEQYLVSISETSIPIPETFLCPIGYPLTNQTLSNEQLIPNHTFRKMIDDFNQKK